MKKIFASLLLTALCSLTLVPTTSHGQRNGNSSAENEPASVPGEMLVQFAPGATDEDQGRALGRANARAVETLRTATMRDDGRGDLVLARYQPDFTPAAARRAVQADPAVEFAEPNYIYTHQAVSTDSHYTDGTLWGMYGDGTSPANQYGSQAGEAWAAGHTGSASVYVGIIDEGIQFTHPDLSGQVWTNSFDPADGVDNDGNGYVDDIHGWDFANNDNTIYDGGTRGSLDDHGTHVSGTIGAKANNSATESVIGVNWNVTLISGKFLGRNGGTTANAIKAVDYFTDLKNRHGLNIVATNNSWGGGGFSQALSDAIVRAAKANILFIAAAGNGGSDGVGDNNDTTASYPSNYDTTSGAGYDSVIAVAAITSSGAKSSFSNYGATTVDIGAPGSGIWSTTAYNTYSSYSGTSMATPHVTGAAALYASTHSGATAAQIKNAILSSAVPTASLSGKTVTGGRLNVSGF
jgi:subtilisin family serine protease